MIQRREKYNMEVNKGRKRWSLPVEGMERIQTLVGTIWEY